MKTSRKGCGEGSDNLGDIRLPYPLTSHQIVACHAGLEVLCCRIPLLSKVESGLVFVNRQDPVQFGMGAPYWYAGTLERCGFASLGQKVRTICSLLQSMFDPLIDWPASNLKVWQPFHS